MARYIPGGRVVLADGTYELGGSVSLNRQKAHLQGMGGSTHLRPSTTGFTALLTADEVHTRVGWLMLIDSGDSAHDVRYGLLDNAQAWTVAEMVHSHGAELRFDDAQGPTVIQFEHHGQGSADTNAGSYAVFFYSSDPANNARTTYPRVEGGWISEAWQSGTLLLGVDHGSIKAVTFDNNSQSSYFGSDPNRFAGIDLMNTRYSSVLSCHMTPTSNHLHGVHDRSDCTENTVFGNKLERAAYGTNSDLLVEGTDSVHAANHADGTIK